MKSSFLRLLTSAAVALALTSVVSFAEEPAKTDAPAAPAAPAAEPAKTEPAKQEATPEKKKEDEKAPATAPAEAPKSEISNHCGSCGKKDEPTTAPATEPAKTEPVKQEDAPAKKDGEKCPGCPSEAPKA
jgi:hypothetical protein